MTHQPNAKGKYPAGDEPETAVRQRDYKTANPTASPKIDAARMISAKLIDMDTSSSPSQQIWEAQPCPITLDSSFKFGVLLAHSMPKKAGAVLRCGEG